MEWVSIDGKGYWEEKRWSVKVRKMAREGEGPGGMKYMIMWKNSEVVLKGK